MSQLGSTQALHKEREAFVKYPLVCIWAFVRDLLMVTIRASASRKETIELRGLASSTLLTIEMIRKEQETEH